MQTRMTSQQLQQQPQPKSFTCFKCREVIKLCRKEDNAGWLRFNLDGTTAHVCEKKEQQQKPQQPSTTNNDLVKEEVAAIKAQLLVRVSRLDRLETELQK